MSEQQTQQGKSAGTSILQRSSSGLLQRKCDTCGQHTIAGGTCSSCEKEKTWPLQRKLMIGASNDPLELEADRVADQVMAGPAHFAVSRGPVRIQRFAVQGGRQMDTAPPSVERVLASSGKALEPGLRRDMEWRFGQDFSQVRLHSGGEAEQSAREVFANAYTVGHDVVFGAGMFAPETHEGRWLIAHELTHVVQQQSGIHYDERSGLPSVSSVHATKMVARQKREENKSGSNVGYVAVYLGKGVDGPCIDFHTKDGIFRYHLDEIGNLKPGEYQTKVAVKGANVDFTLNVASGELFNFSYRLKPGKSNPSRLFADQSIVTFTVTDEDAPSLHQSEPIEEEKHDPSVVYLTLEEASRRCESGDIQGVKVFPYRGTRLGGAPLTVFRDGKDIIVKSYVYVLGNKDFQKQTRTLPADTFIGGIRLKPNEVVRIHTYEPRWYHWNVTGSTSGDIEDEFCVTGEGMMKIGEMSDSAVKWNAALTVVDALTLFVPFGKLATIIGKPAVQMVSRGGRTVAAAMMLGLRDAAPTAFGGIASRSATVLVEEQVVDQVASRAVSKTASHSIIEFSQQPLEQIATRTAGGAVNELGSRGTAEAFTRTVKVTVVDSAGGKIVSTVTTPTKDAELDKLIDQAFGQTFNASGSQVAGDATHGVVSIPPEIAEGFTQAQVAAFKRVLGRAFDTDEIRVLQQLWDAAARPGDVAIINAGNSRYLFDLHRNRFWARVAANPQASQLFTDAGCQFSGGAPYFMLNGNRVTITIDHIIERQSAANLSLTASNLRLVFSRENSVVLRLLNQLDPFQ